jgi:hypothetical protein
LITLQDQYLQAPSLGALVFQKHDTHQASVSDYPLTKSPDPAPLEKMTKRSYNKTRQRERPLFTCEPLFGAKPAGYETNDETSQSLPSFVKVYQPVPTQMEHLEREFAALNCTWLWDAANRVLAFPSNISAADWSHFTQSEKETALKALVSLAPTYPCRPASRPADSPAYNDFRDVLDRAPSWLNGTRNELVLYEFFGGDRMWLWDANYMFDLFTALIAVIDIHGCGEEGWMSARWEVYDTVGFFPKELFSWILNVNSD